MILNNRKPLNDAFANQRLISGLHSATEVLSSLTGEPGIILTNKHVPTELDSNIEQLSNQGWRVLIISPGEPTLAEIKRLSKLSESTSGRFIIALGGGSVIDAAKALRVALDSPDVFAELEDRRLVRVGTIPNQILAIPTTLGSGSESSSSSLLKDKFGIKRILVGTSLVPEIAVLDAELILSAGTQIIASSIMDGIAHAIEGFMSKISNPIMDILAVSSIRIFLNSWKNAINLEISDLQQVQIAGNFAGQVQDKCLVGPAHVLAHHFNKLPHGFGVGLFLIPLIDFYRTNQRKEVKDRFEQLLQYSGSSFEEIKVAMEKLLELATPNQKEKIVQPTESEISTMKADPAGLASPVVIDKDLIFFLVQESVQK